MQRVRARREWFEDHKVAVRDGHLGGTVMQGSKLACVLRSPVKVKSFEVAVSSAELTLPESPGGVRAARDSLYPHKMLGSGESGRTNFGVRPLILATPEAR